MKTKTKYPTTILLTRAAVAFAVAIFALAGSVRAATIERGGDISEYTIEQQLGTVFHDAKGNALSDPLTLCQTNGWTVARIRLFVNPPMTGVEVNTLSYAVTQAVKAKQRGMKILLDIHYSDNWDNPGYHNTPAAWQGQTYSQLLTTVSNYTVTVMRTFISSNVTPSFVQIGNEVGDGFLFPTGGPISFTNGVPGPSTQWSQFVGLIKAGISGAKAVSPTTKIMIHIPGGDWSSWCTEYFDAFTTACTNFDLIGVSYYPYLLGSEASDLSAITATLNALHNRYSGKKLWIAEFSYAWNWGVSNGPVYWNTPTGQYQITRDLCNLVSSYSDGGGVCYWGVFFVDNPSLSYNWEARCLFDYPNHWALPAWGGL
ncbi:MAG TPA: glycosyl hydrolase 53 family protein [Candidatus Acidoferrum sp.]|nr:glycosyl hydrolase 53 family protein [Candidatus Acidoferrum sp.]